VRKYLYRLPVERFNISLRLMNVDNRKEVVNRRILSLSTKQWNDNSIKATFTI
jgi:hypothetical protein